MEEIHCLCALLDGLFSKFRMLCDLFLVCLVIVQNKDVQVCEDMHVRCVVVSTLEVILLSVIMNRFFFYFECKISSMHQMWATFCAESKTGI